MQIKHLLIKVKVKYLALTSSFFFSRIFYLHIFCLHQVNVRRKFVCYENKQSEIMGDVKFLLLKKYFISEKTFIIICISMQDYLVGIYFPIWENFALYISVKKFRVG